MTKFYLPGLNSERTAFFERTFFLERTFLWRTIFSELFVPNMFEHTNEHFYKLWKFQNVGTGFNLAGRFFQMDRASLFVIY